MSYFDRKPSQAVLAIFPMFDEESRLELGRVVALDGAPQHQQLVSSGYKWRRFGDVRHGWGELEKYRNYVQAGQYEQLKAHESQEAAQAYQDAR